MALNLKTLGTRSLSAAFFVVVLLGSLLWNYYSFMLFFFVVAMLGLNEFYKMAGRLGANCYRAGGTVLGILLYISAINTDFAFSFLLPEVLRSQNILLVSPFAILCLALFSKRANPISNALYTLLGILYAVMPFALMHRLVMGAQGSYVYNYHPQVLLGIILLIWSNDTFAYLGGSLFGKNKMIERISPGKTWEGTITGVAITFLLSYFLPQVIKDTVSINWMALGILVPVLATVGDLVESMFKRQAGIKDTGNIMPGHGGVLDRFDSLIFVTPCVVALWSVL